MNNGDRVKIRNAWNSKVEKIADKEGEIVGVDMYRVNVDGEIHYLESPLLELIGNGIESKITYKKACQLESAVYQLVVRMLKRSGLDPYSDEGFNRIGDPADWGEDIDEAVFGALCDIGIEIVHEKDENVLG